jgi:hypothetical protein
MSLELKEVDNPRAFRPFTINRKTNSEMVNLILSFYSGRSGLAIDVTYGAGSFWKKPPRGWDTRFFDKEVIVDFHKVTECDWSQIYSELTPSSADAAFFDPPYTLGRRGGWELNQAEGYSRGYSKLKKNAAYTEGMKYGEGVCPEYLASSLLRALKPQGILVFKNQELQHVNGFSLYDYLIQDNGFQPDGFKLSKPKARPNHAFWMIFTPKAKAAKKKESATA